MGSSLAECISPSADVFAAAADPAISPVELFSIALNAPAGSDAQLAVQLSPHKAAPWYLALADAVRSRNTGQAHSLLQKAPDVYPIEIARIVRAHLVDVKGAHISSMVTQHPDATEADLMQCLEHMAPFEAVTAARHPNATATFLRALYATFGENGADDMCRQLRGAVIAHPNCPSALWRRWLDRPDWIEQQGLLANPNCTEIVSVDQIDYPDRLSPLDILHTVTCPPEMIQRHYATSRETKTAAAFHPRCPLTILEYMSTDYDLFIQLAVASNQSTTDEILRRLMSNPHRVSIRALEAAADHQAASPQTLLSMLDRTRAGAQSALMGSKVIRSIDRMYVAGKIDEAQAYAVVWEVVRPPRFVTHVERGALAGNRSTPPELLGRLRDDMPQIDQILATNPHTPIELLFKLITSKDQTCRELVWRAAMARLDISDEHRAALALSA